MGAETITAEPAPKRQEPAPNVDLDGPVVTFRVDSSKPTVLTTVPFYQDRESERIYRAELSVTFTDDMRATDFSDRTFAVMDLLDNNEKIAGFVSYSPALRKAKPRTKKQRQVVTARGMRRITALLNQK